MATIQIEIDCDEKYCNECKLIKELGPWRSEIACSGFNYKRLDLDISNKYEAKVIRCDECLKAQIK